MGGGATWSPGRTNSPRAGTHGDAAKPHRSNPQIKPTGEVEADHRQAYLENQVRYRNETVHRDWNP